MQKNQAQGKRFTEHAGRRKEKYTARQGGQEGSALILVICIMMVGAVLSLSLLRASGTLLAMRKQIPAKEQCRIMAESVSRLFCRELTKAEYETVPDGQMEGEGLWDYAGAYVCDPKETWPEFRPERGAGHNLDEAKRMFYLDSRSSDGWKTEAGEIAVSLYWINQTDRQWEPGEDWEMYFHEAELELHVEITVLFQDVSCTLTDIYYKVSDLEDGSWRWSKWTERE